MADVLGDEAQDERDGRVAQTLAREIMQLASDSRESFEVIGSALLNALVLTMQAAARAGGTELTEDEVYADLSLLCQAMAEE